MRYLGRLGLVIGLVLTACEADDTDASATGGSGGGAVTSGPGATTAATTSSGPSTSSTGQGGGGEMCSAPTTPCEEQAECCDGYVCGDTSLGHVCCGETSAACGTVFGTDCCGVNWCVIGSCEPKPSCEGPCKQPPALIVEKDRLAAIGGSFLGICGDVNHTYGYHLAAANLPSDDYSLEGEANDPVCEWYASAIDIGMDWPASRDWLAWLIENVREGQLIGVAEVIGSYDGVDVRYWSDNAGWDQAGIPYTGQGHDTWTHVSIHRSTAYFDHGILAGWTADGMQ